MGVNDYNELLVSVLSKKTNSNTIKKNKLLSSNYKKYKSKLLKYPIEKDSWLDFFEKFNKTINKL